MNWINWIARALKADYLRTEAQLNVAYKELTKILLGTLCLIPIMWAINVVGLKEVNFIFFFAGGLFLIFRGFKPRVASISAGAGMAVSELKDQDISQGAIQGLKTLQKVVLGTLLGFWVASGMLATWSFQNAPTAFWPIIAMIMVLTVMSSVYGLKGKMPVKIITLYAVVVIAMAAWQTVPQEWKPEMSSHESSQRSTVQRNRSQELQATWNKDIPAVGVWSNIYQVKRGCNVVNLAAIEFTPLYTPTLLIQWEHELI